MNKLIDSFGALYTLQQHYQDLFPAKSPLAHEMLAQAGLGLLLLERKDQDKKAAASDGEKIVVFDGVLVSDL